MPIDPVFRERVKFKAPLVYSETISASSDVKVDSEEGSLGKHGVDPASEGELLVRIHERGKA